MGAAQSGDPARPATADIPASGHSMYIGRVYWPCILTQPWQGVPFADRHRDNSSRSRGLGINKETETMRLSTYWGSRRLRVIRLALLLIAAAPTVFAQGKWMQIAPFPEPNEEILGVAAGGKLYVIAGLVLAPIWTPIGLV